jgi:DNA-binding winged helix-turn-helix (wHTH) protein
MRESALSVAYEHRPRHRGPAPTQPYAVGGATPGPRRLHANLPLFESRPRPDRIAAAEISFGLIRLLTSQFLLLEGDKPVQLGSRALEILIVLLERAGEVISKQELLARVWPRILVEPASLTVHINALRRQLHDGRFGNRFIINIPTRLQFRRRRQRKIPALMNSKVHLTTSTSSRSRQPAAAIREPAIGGPECLQRP